MKLSLVVPVLNEEAAIPLFHAEVRRTLADPDLAVEIVFVDDGSTDRTGAILADLAGRDPLVRVVALTRCFGKEPALLAGIEAASGDAVVPIDVDGQDPVSVVPLLVERWREGADVVLAKRVDRSSDTRLKRKSAQWFYRFHNRISTTRIEENVGDFRLLSREIVEDVKLLTERNLFMKGVLSWVGGEVAVVEYVRPERVAGVSKFNGWKLWNLALEGITSFSTLPLRVWTYLGFGVATLAFLYGVWMIVDKLLWGNAVPGYPSLLVSVLFLGGVQLIGIGILGEYIGRIYIETKARPRYVVRRPADPASDRRRKAGTSATAEDVPQPERHDPTER